MGPRCGCPCGCKQECDAEGRCPRCYNGGCKRPSAEQAPDGQGGPIEPDLMALLNKFYPLECPECDHKMLISPYALMVAAADSVDLQAQLSTTREIARELAAALENITTEYQGKRWIKIDCGEVYLDSVEAVLAKALAAGLMDAQRPLRDAAEGGKA